jgi:hypothetical protein
MRETSSAILKILVVAIKKGDRSITPLACRLLNEGEMNPYTKQPKKLRKAHEQPSSTVALEKQSNRGNGRKE